MEGRDLSSSTAAPSSNRDGSSTTGPDDVVFSVTVALAKDAALHFQSGKFAECVEVLKQLLLKKPDDPKVLHNIAIAEYFRDDCSDPQKLIGLLNGVKRKSNELAQASGEQGDSANNVGNKVVLGSKASNALAPEFSGASSTSTMYTDEFDSSVAMLNIAIVWFHLHEYSKTLSVLEPLYQNIEPIDETTALHICLLLLDASLACHDASKSADVLTYLEKAFGVSCVSQGDNVNSAQQQSANLITKSSYVPSSASVADASSSDLGPNVNASENHLSRALSDETFDYEAMILDMGGQNLARPTGPSSNDHSRALVDQLSTVELKLKLQLYKVRFLLLTRNLKLAKREVKLAMNVGRGRDSSMALLLKSQLEYARGNHRKAIKLLMASGRGDPDAAFTTSIFNNNLGCIYYQLGKHQTSSLFFSKALTACSSLRKEQPLKLATFSRDNSLLIVYNSGVQYLACGKPILAACCFEKASLIFYKQPLLWLRLSECCLMALEKGLITSGGAPSDSLVGVRVVGKGKWRQLVVEDQIPRNGLVNSSKRDECRPGNDRQPKLSMSFARQCLLNALHLLDSCRTGLKSGLPSNSSVEESDPGELLSSKNSNNKNLHGIDSKALSVSVGLNQVNSNGDAKEQKGGISQEFIQNSLTYYDDICRRENQLIKQATLANLAFVELELDNPVKALSVARCLLELPECLKIYIFLGHVYAAEALCLLNRPKEAAEHLSVYLSGSNNFDLPFSLEDCDKWQVKRVVENEEANGGSTAANNPSLEDSQAIVFLKPEEARATLYANFAVMSALQGEFEQAYQLVTQALSILPNSPEATLTSVYVDLSLGKQQEALAKLKKCSRIKFLHSGITLNKSS
ncbi:CCR4-NOT transcription complex subunit 10 [Neltuma alba]|uniref:CCR4-NOT transcription complex subunit 10-like n=1 Tax=Neltuma alba TaxID=207710 RepID=UPI0010A50DA0|nr:CCR4-NOT transcription complex subunit 10-like [Prosopis alba]XP_028790451.1 CCR4-NOT transcription complex subunit 10-like [Prosopis alba]